MVLATDNEVTEEVIEAEARPEIRKEIPVQTVSSLEIAAVESKGRSEKEEFLSAAEAMNLQSKDENLDMRPYLFDANSKSYALWDTGSQISAWPPDAGDTVDPSVRLKAVNGSRLKCYGYKEISIKVNRKSYPIRVIKTDVENPIIGWDFVRKYRLETAWTQWGDVVMRDPKAQIEKILKYKALKAGQAHHISVVQEEKSVKSVEQSLFELAAVEALGDQEDIEIYNDIEKLPEGPYKELLKRFPELLQFTFKDEEPKHGIIHRIDTANAPPSRAKVRKYPPGSPKAVKGREAIMELLKLGIIERVDPSEPNNWSSPVHFTVKPD